MKVNVSGTGCQDTVEINTSDFFKMLTLRTGITELSFTKFRKTDLGCYLVISFCGLKMRVVLRYLLIKWIDKQVNFGCFFYLYIYIN